MIFFLKIIDLGNPMTWSKPGTQALDRADYLAGFKNYDIYNKIEIKQLNLILYIQLTFIRQIEQ